MHRDRQLSRRLSMCRGLMTVCALLIGAASATSRAQETKKEDVKKTDVNKKEVDKKEPQYERKPNGLSRGRGVRKATPGEVEIHFLNGSKVRLLIQSEEVEIATPYGKLSVPLREIRDIEFGLHMP